MGIFKSLAELQWDLLKEIGNIGAGHAATALSTLLMKPVDMLVPEVRLVPFEEISESLGGPEALVVAIFLRVEGETPGNLFFLLSMESSKRILENLVGIKPEEGMAFNEMELSALSEIGNILAGSYLSSLADFTNLNMQPTVPALAVDMAGAILSTGLDKFGEMGDQALFIDTKFLQASEVVEGHFFFIPDPESFERIFAALGVEGL